MSRVMTTKFIPSKIQNICLAFLFYQKSLMKMIHLSLLANQTHRLSHNGDMEVP